jgi:hypothetical protein
VLSLWVVVNGAAYYTGHRGVSFKSAGAGVPRD